MIFSLDVRRALKGDCLLVHYGSNNAPGLAVIDGGPSGVYHPHLKPRLEQIREARGLTDDESLILDLVMVSHIDDDHIHGLLDMTDELVTDFQAHRPLLFKVRDFWHNTFDEIVGGKSDDLVAAVTASFGPAALTGEPDTEGLDPCVAMVLASVRQGLRLLDDAKNLGFPRNTEFDEKPVVATSDGTVIEIGDYLKLTVVGPMQEELDRLKRDYEKFLEKQESEKKTTAALAAFTDTSVANLSSIVVLAEVGQKTILLTGDARGDKVLKGLELAGLLEPNGKMHVDILKMPHHGSDRNMDPVFFRRITADHYVFSGDGEYGNPELGTFKMMLDECEDNDFTIHLTYPIDEIDVARKRNWESEQRKERNKKEKKPETEVREDWQHDKHSLEAFFEENEDFAEKVSVVEADEPHVIDLLDELGF